MDPQDLTIVYNLSSRVEPEWIQCYSIITRPNKGDQCIGLTPAGMVKVWSLTDLEKKVRYWGIRENEVSGHGESPLRGGVAEIGAEEREDRLLLFPKRAAAPHRGSWVVARRSTVLSSHFSQVLDLDDLSFVFSIKCPVPAVSGQIVDIDKVSIGYNDQSLRIYQLPLS